MRSIELEPETHIQLRALYQSLLGQEARYRQFKELLALYPADPTQSEAQEWAALARERVNATLREWIGEPFQALSPNDLLLWRSIVVEERFNVPENSPDRSSHEPESIGVSVETGR